MSNYPLFLRVNGIGYCPFFKMIKRVESFFDINQNEKVKWSTLYWNDEDVVNEVEVEVEVCSICDCEIENGKCELCCEKK